MNIREQKKKARSFVERWTDRGNERQDSQSFWLDLLGTVYGIENPTTYITFEDKVMLDHTSFIDGYIDKTKVMIEQKGSNKDLNKAIKQSDGSYLTPFQQAKRYSANLPYSQRPRWIVTSNFKEFFVYDMEQPNAEATVIKLEDLEEEFYRLEFLVDKTNEHLEREMKISMQAGEIVAELYDGLLKQYINPNNPDTLHAINQLIVRLVFCFYAEDSGLFGHKLAFHDYMARFSNRDFRRGLMDLFDVLDTNYSERDPYLDDELSNFPYVNGGMFSERRVEIPNFTEELRELILEHASSSFDWSAISPTIFGAVFESTLNPETRRSGGMHYTSIDNIHKVIDPLFLDELKDELNEIRQLKQPKVIEQKAKQFQSKLADLTFFDPACGSGNFLTETYISIRKLENEAIKLYMGDTVKLDVEDLDLVKVKLNQFYGIEINDFAVSVAKTALWIAESQMLEQTKEIVFANIDFLPLKSYTHIIHGNALTINWESVVPKKTLNYIIGNPPFVGHQWQTKEQKEGMAVAFSDLKKHGKLDFVSSWFAKATQLMQDSSISTALVATNSIVQGEAVRTLWEYLFGKGVEIQFAYQSFKWTSEAKDRAGVSVVIVGFTAFKTQKPKLLFNGDSKEICNNINAYLVKGDNYFIQSRGKPLNSNMPIMTKGSQPTDGGNLILSPEEKAELLVKYPSLSSVIKPYIGSNELINNKERYCLWLVNLDPILIREIPELRERLEAVREIRLTSPTKSVQQQAWTPQLFTQIRQPNVDYIVVPEVSSERRRYIPIGFLDKETIVSNLLYMIPEKSLYIFGVLNSNVHMAWTRVVAGRLEDRYRYTPAVYNNFPWLDLTEEARKTIEKTAQGILDARSQFPNNSLAELYDDISMPPALVKAHQENDKAVMKAYNMVKLVDNKKTWLTESETVARLFEMYEKMTVEN
ncbi:DNA methyltransferase [Streptococcus sp. V869]